MHFCTAYIAIANDEQQVAFRGPYDPVSWPEVEVLRQIHGDEAVRNVKPFVHVEQTAKAEKERLGLIYGNIVSEKVWVGRNSSMELDAAEMDVLEPGTLWKNPLTKEVGPVSEASSAEDVETDEAADNGKPAKRSHHKKKTDDEDIL
jgi:hypothetical protein